MTTTRSKRRCLPFPTRKRRTSQKLVLKTCQNVSQENFDHNGGYFKDEIVIKVYLWCFKVKVKKDRELCRQPDTWHYGKTNNITVGQVKQIRGCADVNRIQIYSYSHVWMSSLMSTICYVGITSPTKFCSFRPQQNFSHRQIKNNLKMVFVIELFCNHQKADLQRAEHLLQ